MSSKLKLSDLTREEKSLLLFLETQAVDYGGLVNIAYMNDSDAEILERWTKEEFVQSGRVCAESIQRINNPLGRASRKTMWVKLTTLAFSLAHKERKERAQRMWKKRAWKTTEEARNEDATG